MKIIGYGGRGGRERRMEEADDVRGTTKGKGEKGKCGNRLVML